MVLSSGVSTEVLDKLKETAAKSSRKYTNRRENLDIDWVGDTSVVENSDWEGDSVIRVARKNIDIKCSESLHLERSKSNTEAHSCSS